MQIVETKRDQYTISNDPSLLNISFIYEFLTQQTYWAQNRSLDTVQRSISNSLNFGVYYLDEQVGFARVVTDAATFAWICDVFILPQHRKNGLGKWLVECIVNHPDLKPIRRLLLATRDAHGLYQNYGWFAPRANIDRWMEKFNPNT